MKALETFDIEVTDTFGGEANYCWARRYRVRATSFLGAIQWLSRNHGSGWRCAGDYGDSRRYDMPGAAICCFVSYAEE